MEKPKMSGTELGGLWMTYQKKTMISRILEYFIEHADDKKAQHMMSGLWKQLHAKINETNNMFENEGAVLPQGFTEEDVNRKAPKLWENGFDIMFCRVLKEISTGLYALHLSIAYREDVINFYKQLSSITQSYYNDFTQYLLGKSILPRPTYTTMPTSTDYITDKAYMKGTNIMGDKRPLNTIEFGLLYHSIETNITGMNLMRGFAQTAKDKEAKEYFIKGIQLSKKILKQDSDVLLQNNIQPPATSGETLTDSLEAPFSDKLMVFCTYLLSSLSIGGQGFSASFNMRNDLDVKAGLQGKDVFTYAREAELLMISKGWLEEPPKMDV
ncbi:DUF3231 family protein [Virgibacillus alimentarius]|uniref:DUF3231 family protein n=1 Tax=Virgibacillus alimentarius TaxID=698769 RepID=A0ABS4SCM4_9BACI|nr:DUF3231 family protein [Virgibacillus alimentarius]MBP2258770.1 hypothetical protein [Virgibacillus alimentarius]